MAAAQRIRQRRRHPEGDLPDCRGSLRQTARTRRNRRTTTENRGTNQEHLPAPDTPGRACRGGGATPRYSTARGNQRTHSAPQHPNADQIAAQSPGRRAFGAQQPQRRQRPIRSGSHA